MGDVKFMSNFVHFFQVGLSLQLLGNWADHDFNLELMVTLTTIIEKISINK